MVWFGLLFLYRHECCLRILSDFPHPQRGAAAPHAPPRARVVYPPDPHGTLRLAMAPLAGWGTPAGSGSLVGNGSLAG